MLHKTRGIVLRTVKYGDTSVIVGIFTELFGLQSYIVNGVRSAKPKAAKGVLLQPGNILELVVYHQEIKNLQRISEFKLGYIYTSLHYNVVKNTIALYLIELLQKSLKQPEQHLDLYYFTENTLQLLDGSPTAVIANLPLYYTLKLGAFLGFRLNGRFSEYTPYLDLQEGTFSDLPPHHTAHLDPEYSELTDRLFQCHEVQQLAAINMSKEKRRKLLYAYLEYLRLHMPDFTELHSPPILHEILDA
ncbi:DNA repair protein RecO [Chitinophaga qingshengii]|uniref:DNA repair protein RecO n=1 Tax=Chitinophaga qingshengii TaxID=1569794 RepID=A0ABR7TLK3_9BACT|nr:DNA repair protein RecO [Chitinophaga qingshengii]MBC9931366.1 DNA repair protein RecO [Chitinophaga qingshengii]